eukprot:3251220-Pyramimonas_sp.AAC.1
MQPKDAPLDTGQYRGLTDRTATLRALTEEVRPIYPLCIVLCIAPTPSCLQTNQRFTSHRIARMVTLVRVDNYFVKHGDAAGCYTGSCIDLRGFHAFRAIQDAEHVGDTGKQDT